MNSAPFTSLAADVHEHLNLILLGNVVFDPASGSLAAQRLESDGSTSSIRLDIHADDRAKLAEASGQGQVRADLRMAAGPQGNFGLVLLECQGGTTWARGAMIDLPTPDFANEKLATRSRLAELGKQCAAVAHELRQPLFTIAMASENMRMALEEREDLPQPAISALEHIQQEVERARAIIDQTLNYAAGRSGNTPETARGSARHRQADFASAVRHAARLLAYEMEKGEIGLNLGMIVSPLPVAMSQIELEQILLNILRNSVESIETRKLRGWPGKGTVELRLEQSASQMRCTISDNGIGLAGTEPESGFQPFVTTKGDDGNGLGLYICEQLLAKAGGRLRLLPGEAEGALVQITLPLGPADGVATR